MADVRAQPVLVDESTGYKILIDYDGNGNPIYIGKALPGSATSSPVWQICKIEYTNGNVSAIKWADGDDFFDNVWDNRASLSYN